MTCYPVDGAENADHSDSQAQSTEEQDEEVTLPQLEGISKKASAVVARRPPPKRYPFWRYPAALKLWGETR